MLEPRKGELTSPFLGYWGNCVFVVERWLLTKEALIQIPLIRIAPAFPITSVVDIIG